jgi:hypothetical protein
MEAICSSETSADFQRTTQRYILEDSTGLYKVFPEQREAINFVLSTNSSPFQGETIWEGTACL